VKRTEERGRVDKPLPKTFTGSYVVLILMRRGRVGKERGEGVGGWAVSMVIKQEGRDGDAGCVGD
jgi:hypothetical protein